MFLYQNLIKILILIENIFAKKIDISSNKWVIENPIYLKIIVKYN